MLSPGPVLQDQPKTLVKNLKKNIPLGRLANKSEYKSAIKFLISEESSYITGQNIIVDGGRTCW
jgi:NAD(P)-dependent dehydrogenase (short-subunit alcohol dehydrogenase family)